MSRLSEMIKELCPDGVEYRWFEDCCEYVRGITYNKSNEARSDSDPVWRVLRANNITLSSNTLNFDDVKLIEKTVRVKGDQFLTKGDILICAGSGSKEHIGKVAYIDEDMEYTFGGFMAVIRCNSSIDSRYLFHIFTSKLFLLYLDTALNSSTINNLNFTVMKKFIFPVPPLPIQNEIVKMLDNFTELTAELTAELALRKKQYNFYRDSLLNFSQDVSSVEWKTLREISAHICSGGTPRKTNSAYYNGGTIPWLRTQEVAFNYIEKATSFITEEGLKNSSAKWIPVHCVIVAISGATAGRSAVNNIPITTNQHCCNFEINDEMADYKYVFYWVKSQYEQIKGLGRGARADLNADIIGSYPIPIPPLDVQQKIVSILDRFDTLCNDLTQGLPAEIAARKKQYEYYRDKLLTFRRK